LEPLREWLELFPALLFKLDPAGDWDDRLIAEIAATGDARLPTSPVTEVPADTGFRWA
jgi:hypothetical protein